MGADHPITWCHRRLGGPAFYTGAGHTPESYAESGFLRLLLGGLRYAAGTVRWDDRPEAGLAAVPGPEDVDGWAGEWSGGVKFAWRQEATVRLGGREVPLDGTCRNVAGNAHGDWNTTELADEGGRLVGYLNGMQVLDLDSSGWGGEVTLSGGVLRRILRRTTA
jgi:hypothetical protein